MAPRQARPRIVVVGDLVVDVVLAPDRPLADASDVPGRVMLRQGGSATTTARWLGRTGTRTSLVCSIGRDAAGRALVDEVRSSGVVVRAVRLPGVPTGRIGVFVVPGGERSFVQDRAAALLLAPEHLRSGWFAGADLVHLPVYSLLAPPLGDAGRRAAELGHAAGALVAIDLSSTRPLLDFGRNRALEMFRAVRPDLVFASGSEAGVLVRDDDGLLDLAPIAILRRGAKGATVLARDGSRTLRFDVATRPIAAPDTTGAGDAFNAGFLAAWLPARKAGLAAPIALRRAVLAGHRLAARHLAAPRVELRIR